MATAPVCDCVLISVRVSLSLLCVCVWDDARREAKLQDHSVRLISQNRRHYDRPHSDLVLQVPMNSALSVSPCFNAHRVCFLTELRPLGA